MPDSRQNTSQTNPPDYRVERKGSRYNIFGPQGPIFTKNQSASQAGPRWEELTCTPWPYQSTAYERGFRLWELGLIGLDQIGQRDIVMLQNGPESVPKSRRAGGKPALTKPVRPIRLRQSQLIWGKRQKSGALSRPKLITHWYTSRRILRKKPLRMRVRLA